MDPVKHQRWEINRSA